MGDTEGNDIFLSYATKNRAFVDKIRCELECNNYTTWMDYRRIEGGDNWKQEIESNLRKCKVVIVTITEDSIKSKWVERECILAENLSKTRIPLLRTGGELPFHLIDLQYIDFRKHDELSYKKGVLELLDVLKKYLPKNMNTIIQDGDFDHNSSNGETDCMDAETNSVVSTIGKLWQTKNLNAKAYRVCMHCRRQNSERIVRNYVKKFFQTHSQQQHSAFASPRPYTFNDINNNKPSEDGYDHDQTRETIQRLLFCVPKGWVEGPKGWVEGQFPSETDAQAAKDFLCRSSMQIRQTKEGREATGLGSFLESFLSYLDLSERNYRSRTIEKVQGKIVLKLRLANKNIGPLDFMPDRRTLKLLLEGIDNIYQSLEEGKEYCREKVLVSGSWEGCVCILFQAPEGMIQTLINIWEASRDRQLELSDGISLIDVHSLYIVTPSHQQDASEGKYSTAHNCRLNASLESILPFCRLNASLESILECLQSKPAKFLFEEEKDHFSDFTAYKHFDGDEFTFLIPASDDCLESFLSNDSDYWHSMEKVLSTSTATRKTMVSFEGGGIPNAPSTTSNLPEIANSERSQQSHGSSSVVDNNQRNNNSNAYTMELKVSEHSASTDYQRLRPSPQTKSGRPTVPPKKESSSSHSHSIADLSQSSLGETAAPSTTSNLSEVEINGIINGINSLIQDMVKIPGNSEVLAAIICGTINEHGNVPAVQAHCLRLIWDAGKHSDENKEALLAAGGPSKVVGAMRSFPDSVSVQEKGCGAIWSLGVNSSNRVVLIRAGACQQILLALKSFMSTEPLIRAAIGAMRTLSTDPEARDLLCSIDGPKIVSEAMALHRGYVSIQRDGCAFLSNSAVDVEKQIAKVVPFEEVDAVIQAMATHRNELSVMQGACFALKNFTYEETNCRLVRSCKGIIPLMEYAATYEASPGCMENAAVILERLQMSRMMDESIEEQAYMELIWFADSESNTLEVQKKILDFLNDFVWSPRMTSVAIEILRKMITEDASQGDHLFTSGSIRDVVRCCQDLAWDERVCAEGCRLVACLSNNDANHDTLLEAGTESFIVKSLLGHRSKVDVVKNAFEALSLLCRNDRWFQEIKQQMSLIAETHSSYPTNDSIQTSYLSILSMTESDKRPGGNSEGTTSSRGSSVAKQHPLFPDGEMPQSSGADTVASAFTAPLSRGDSNRSDIHEIRPQTEVQAETALVVELDDTHEKSTPKSLIDDSMLSIDDATSDEEKVVSVASGILR